MSPISYMITTYASLRCTKTVQCHRSVLNETLNNPIIVGNRCLESVADKQKLFLDLCGD